MTKIRFSGANNWHHAYLTELQGKIQEEERDCYEIRSCLKSDSAGRNHVFGRTRRCGGPMTRSHLLELIQKAV